jgi:hypothetical protein
MAFAARECRCGNTFVPKGHSIDQKFTRTCPSCRRAAGDETGTFDRAKRRPKVNASVEPSETFDLKAPGPPLIQAVFDLETFNLNRNWGVLMVGSITTFGPNGTESVTFDLTESPSWPDRRSDDSDLALKIMDVLDEAHVWIAHNGERFDVRWLRTLALKADVEFRTRKLIDPCQIAWRNYSLSNNSLGTITNFLFPDNPELRKMPVPEEVWRRALLDNDKSAWATLRARCESDVKILAAVAGRVMGDVGLVDTKGSWR